MCDSCTFHNAPTDTACAMCGTRQPGHDGVRFHAPTSVVGDAAYNHGPGRPAGAAPASLLSTPSLASRPRCGNKACSAVVSARGEAKELGLCSRCYAELVQPFDSDSALTTALVARYVGVCWEWCGVMWGWGG